MDAEKNMQLMQTLDDAWNTQDWDTFNRRHAEGVAVYWPGQPEPTRGRKAHEEEAKQFFKTFPDNHVRNRPYKIFFAQGVDLFGGGLHGHHERTDDERKRRDHRANEQEV